MSSGKCSPDQVIEILSFVQELEGDRERVAGYLRSHFKTFVKFAVQQETSRGTRLQAHLMYYVYGFHMSIQVLKQSLLLFIHAGLLNTARF